MTDDELKVEIRRLGNALVLAQRELSGRELDRLIAAYGSEAPHVSDPYAGTILDRKTGEHRIVWCFYCGTRPGWQVEHKLPRSRGGGDDVDNTVRSCATCNRAKGTMTVEEYRASIEANIGKPYRFFGEPTL